MVTKAQGTTIAIGDGATSETFTTIAKIINWDGPDEKITVIDATSLDSSVKEKVAGLKDGGQLTFDALLVPGDTGQDALITDMNAGTNRNFKITLQDTGNQVMTFSALVTGFKIAGSMDDRVVASVTLDLTTAVTWV